MNMQTDLQRSTWAETNISIKERSLAEILQMITLIFIINRSDIIIFDALDINTKKLIKSVDELNGPNTSTNSKRSGNPETKENIHNGHYVGFNSSFSRSRQLRRWIITPN